MKTFTSRAVFVTTGVALALVAGACARTPLLQSASAPAPVTRAPEAPAPIPPAPVALPAPVAVAPAPPPAPEPRRTPPAQFRANAAVKTVHFDFEKAILRPDAAKVLDANAAWLIEHPGYQLLIEGHCDERGTNEYNLALGDRRATATMAYLAAQGVRRDRMTVVSFGEQRPACTEHQEMCWQKNRRADFLVKEQ